jgi:hypothetical protein
MVYSLLSKKAAAGTLNFFPQSVNQLRFDGVTPVLTMGLAVQNTSAEKFVIRSVAGNAYSNGYLVGNIAAFYPQTIYGNAQSVIQLDCRLGLIGIVQDIIRAFQYGNFSQNIELQLYANVDNLQIPILDNSGHNLTYKIGA